MSFHISEYLFKTEKLFPKVYYQNWKNPQVQTYILKFIFNRKPKSAPVTSLQSINKSSWKYRLQIVISKVQRHLFSNSVYFTRPDFRQKGTYYWETSLYEVKAWLLIVTLEFSRFKASSFNWRSWKRHFWVEATNLEIVWK